jgi:hypothetical protein
MGPDLLGTGMLVSGWNRVLRTILMLACSCVGFGLFMLGIVMWTKTASRQVARQERICVATFERPTGAALTQRYPSLLFSPFPHRGRRGINTKRERSDLPTKANRPFLPPTVFWGQK